MTANDACPGCATGADLLGFVDYFHYVPHTYRPGCQQHRPGQVRCPQCREWVTPDTMDGAWCRYCVALPRSWPRAVRVDRAGASPVPRLSPWEAMPGPDGTLPWDGDALLDSIREGL